ncbi:MAG TPA: nitroreductase family protein, partial [Pseudoxanthomonas sp.]|nr:nitroreductase family protein [Pseudoxanthomonas sp.]
MSEVLRDAALDQLFRTARTQNKFLDRPVEDAQLRALYDLLKWAPTAANTNPARFVF